MVLRPFVCQKSSEKFEKAEEQRIILHLTMRALTHRLKQGISDGAKIELMGLFTAAPDLAPNGLPYSTHQKINYVDNDFRPSKKRLNAFKTMF
ncbi:hypothetical protein NPIL_266381 [Nephila pilipes]|uniref:Uncharacterized protein n=1 Tax=Nephila pilipes TaxID=299642 RepID=A0A8X6TPZ0_NEPPI|nr:hypothetical protein NPIL_266381 [Nephila pilipes]